MSSGRDDSTLTTHAGGASRRAAGTEPALFVVFQADRLDQGGCRYMLGGVDTVILGRGDERRASRKETDARSILELRLADRRMSTTHARIERALGGWVLEDLGSKNGSAVNGELVERREVRDGDVIEVGHTYLVLRTQLPLGGRGRGDLDSASLRAAPPGLATLVPEVTAQFERLEQVAPTGVPVLIGGASGTGKELTARAVHALSGRRGDYIAVNCGAIPETLIESELFGHKKGAFSGATADKLGHVRSADRGTLFLDEIGDLPPASQAALLRVLQEGEVVPVGTSKPIPVDLRVVAATHRDLDQLVESGQFRRDLLARLSGLRVELPPLSGRREDLGLLLSSFVDGDTRLTREAARAILGYDWPLNIRELGNRLTTARALAGTGALDVDHLSLPASPPAAPAGRSRELSAEDRALRDELVALLEEHAGNITAVARAKGKARMQIHRWLKRFALDPGSFRKP